QGARLALLSGAALAEAAAAQSRAELIDGLRTPGEVVRGKPVGVHGQVSVDAIEPRHHAGERAHVLAEARHRRARGDGPVSAAGHDQLAGCAKRNRRRRALWVAQLLAAAGRTLRARRHIMPRNGRAHEVEADDVIAEVGGKAGGARFGDRDAGTLNPAVPDRFARQWRDGDATHRSAVEERPDLAVALHALGNADPAGTLARSQQRPHKGEDAGW